MIFTTIIKAIDPRDGELKIWGGDRVEAISFDDAQHVLDTTGRGYMEIHGRLIEEIPCDEKMNPMWDKSINYENLN